ncbi:methyl-accepting chemotaxis sensory transducer [Salinisphaera sp. C84B14]|uniref:methyl-accepting chemotaxis protein n=1 Tax=Salinisphaera sp. C84B14 TaxID=1304155 RepID=UPI00334168BD
MRLRTRIMLGFSAVLSLMVLLTAIGIWQVEKVDGLLTYINDVNSKKQRYAINYRGSVHDRAIALRDALLVDDAELGDVEALIANLAADYDRAHENMQAMQGEVDFSDMDMQLLAAINEIGARTVPLTERVLDLRRDGARAEARQLVLAEARPAYMTWLNRINDFIDYQEQQNNVDVQATRETTSGFRNIMIALTLFALLLGAGIAFVIARQLIRTFGAEPYEVRWLAESIGRGDLAVDTSTYLRKAHAGSIMACLVQTVATLRDTVTRVDDAAHSVSDASDRIEHQNARLSERTDGQASALEQSSAAMEQLTSTVGRNADSAREAERLASDASDIAERGGSVFNEVQSTMQRIHESAREIFDIIGMIDEIAFQTNLLALNASVEAARAGEQGRGFAVVAQEVRSLATRSAEAARQIKDLINQSVSQTEQGTERATHAGQTIQAAVEAIQRVTRHVAEISQACAEQSIGVSEVSTSIGQIDQNTQDNARMVEQSNADAKELNRQAKLLLSAISEFRLQRVSDPARSPASDAVLQPADATPAYQPA